MTEFTVIAVLVIVAVPEDMVKVPAAAFVPDFISNVAPAVVVVNGPSEGMLVFQR